jgi:thioredoxin-related protein
MKRPLLIFLFVVAPVLTVHAQDASVPAEGINWHTFEEAVAMAKKEKKKIIVDIYAPWCTWCRKLQREVYTDPDIREYVNKNFVITRLDGEDKEETVQFKEYSLTPSELALGFGLQGYPTTVFLDAESDYITRLPGFADVPEFKRVLTYIGTDAFVDRTYQEFVGTK